MAQWLAQATHNRLVVGSNPTGPTNAAICGVKRADEEIMGRGPGQLLREAREEPKLAQAQGSCRLGWAALPWNVLSTQEGKGSDHQAVKRVG